MMKRCTLKIQFKLKFMEYMQKKRHNLKTRCIVDYTIIGFTEECLTSHFFELSDLSTAIPDKISFGILLEIKGFNNDHKLMGFE